ncbi:MAG: QueT transporter family protein [Erysipelotrichaceae bacterium]|nr:QueT transporter family protein [Erysipelotrichaceae bacterium]
MKLSLTSFVKVALIAALYSTVSLVLAPFSFGNIQVRVAEGLTLLPLLSPLPILGLTLGCFITNFIGVIMGVNILGRMDVIIGTFATLIAALLTYYFRNIKIKGFPLLSTLMPVVINAIIIGAELAYVFAPEFTLSYFLIFALEVGIGQFIAVYLVGLPILNALKKRNISLD